MTTFGKILNYWIEEGHLFACYKFSISMREPMCWACSQYWACRFDVKTANTTRSECVKAWEKAPLQKCHIVPRSLGGSNEPSNLYLMCEACHDLAPDTTSRELFFQWARYQQVHPRDEVRLRIAFQEFGLDINDEVLATKVIETVKSAAFKLWSRSNMGIHMFQGTFRFGSGYSHSTMVAGILSYWEMNDSCLYSQS